MTKYFQRERGNDVAKREVEWGCSCTATLMGRAESSNVQPGDKSLKTMTKEMVKRCI